MKPGNEKDSQWTQKDEKALQTQTCVLVAVACIFCAAAILFQLYFRGEVLYDKTEGSTTASMATSPMPENSTISDSNSSLPQSSEVNPVQEKINISTATAEELDTLPNIGPVKAEAIIQYREEQGPFYTIEQIQEVDGIGEKTFEKIKDMITI